MRRKLFRAWVLLLGLMPILLVVGCGDGMRTVDVADVTKPTTIVLKKETGQGHIFALTIEGAGRIDGSAKISMLTNSSAYQTETLSGNVTFRWEGDWYSDDIKVRYTPATVSGGELRLRYRFADL